MFRLKQPRKVDKPLKIKSIYQILTNEEKTDITEMWFYRMMQRILWTVHVGNENVLIEMETNKTHILGISRTHNKESFENLSLVGYTKIKKD